MISTDISIERLPPELQKFAADQLECMQAGKDRVRFQSGMTQGDVLSYLEEIEAEARNSARQRQGKTPLTIFFLGRINPGCAQELQEILSKQDFDEIHLLINTQGGDIHEAHQMYFALRQLRCPVHTYALGGVESAGLYLYLAGTHRHADSFSSFLYHPPTSFFDGEGVSLAIPDARSSVRRLTRDIRTMARLTTARTGTPAAEVRRWQSRDTPMTGKEALERGICTSLVKNIPGLVAGRLTKTEWVWRYSGVERRRWNDMKHLVKSRPQWRMILTIGRLIAVAKYDALKKRYPDQLALIRRIPWMKGFLAGVTLWAAIAGWREWRSAPEVLTQNMQCASGKDACAAAWALHQKLGPAPDPNQLGSGATYIEEAKSGPLKIKHLRLFSHVSTDPVIDEYEVKIVLADGAEIVLFKPVVVSRFLAATVQNAEWLGSEDLSRAFTQIIENDGIERTSPATAVAPGIADLRRAGDAAQVMHRYSGLVAPPLLPEPESKPN